MKRINPLKTPGKKHEFNMKSRAGKVSSKQQGKSKYARPSIIKALKSTAAQISLRYAEASEFLI